jgi:transcription termination factor NusB
LVVRQRRWRKPNKFVSAFSKLWQIGTFHDQLFFNPSTNGILVKRALDEALEIFKRNVDEFAPGTNDGDFMEKLERGVISKQKELDTIIEKAAPDWPIDKISVMDRNILRIGLV